MIGAPASATIPIGQVNLSSIRADLKDGTSSIAVEFVSEFAPVY
jgi:hypothetical protein